MVHHEPESWINIAMNFLENLLFIDSNDVLLNYAQSDAFYGKVNEHEVASDCSNNSDSVSKRTGGSSSSLITGV